MDIGIASLVGLIGISLGEVISQMLDSGDDDGDGEPVVAEDATEAAPA